MTIYNSNGTTLVDITPDDSSYHIETLMGDNHIMLYFSSATHVDIPVGAYILMYGTRFTVLFPESIKLQHRTLFEYTVQFHAWQGFLNLWKYRNYVDSRTKFSLTATAQEHLQYLVSDLNRRTNATVTIGQTTYSYGTGITWTGSSGLNTAEKLITYDNITCMEALELIAETFETEFKINGTSIILEKIEYNKDNPHAMSYGKNNGFLSGVTRSNANTLPPVDMMLVQGGNTNIDKSTYHNDTLLLPYDPQRNIVKSMGYDGTYFEDEEGYDPAIANTFITLDGNTILNVNAPLSTHRVETSIDCSDIYPKRVGTVSSVSTNSSGYYLVTDNSIPNTLNYSNYVLAGETMTLIFQSGQLAGREFEVQYHHNDSYGVRQFTLIPIEEEGLTLPASGGYEPAVGDTYAVFHCSLPNAYIRNDSDKSGASWDMMRQAIKSMYEMQLEQYNFQGEVDPVYLYLRRMSLTLRTGMYISFTDPSFQSNAMLMRITSIKSNINSVYKKELTMSTAQVRRSKTKITLTTVSGKIGDGMHLFNQGQKSTSRTFRGVKGNITSLDTRLGTTNTNLTELQGRVGTFIPNNSTVQFGGKLLYSGGNLTLTNAKHKATLFHYAIKDEDYVLKSDDRLIVANGNIKLTLPDNPVDGVIYDFKNISNAEVTIQSTNQRTPIIRDGVETDSIIMARYKSMSMIYLHGTGWIIVMNN